MLAAIDTEGQVYVGLTQVNTDSEIMSSFLYRLSLVLDREDPHWRDKSILVLDGARYHTSIATRTMLR